MKKVMIPVVILIIMMQLVGCDMLFGYKLVGTKWKNSMTIDSKLFENVIEFITETEGKSTSYQDGIVDSSDTFAYTWDPYTRTGTGTSPQNEVYTIYLSEDKNKLICEYNGIAQVFVKMSN